MTAVVSILIIQLNPDNVLYKYTYISPRTITYNEITADIGNKFEQTYKVNYKGIDIVIETGVSKSKFEELISYIDNTNDKFIKANPKIYLITSGIVEMYKGTALEGKYSEDSIIHPEAITKHITGLGTIQCVVFLPQDTLSEATYYHEMFHVYDYKNGKISDKSDFIIIVGCGHQNGDVFSSGISHAITSNES